MSKVCHYCGKAPVSGNSVSHAHNVNKRQFKPNLHNKKVDVAGERRTVKICTKCLKSM
ncbi:50S ribosomal protein L28 [Chitinivibrio alkaliphilus]|uniref:Large ribosomal subunit protein bL28 n=1 Tax=Chitinivibrio alkaliphilus ACht1 TaxID=1313304 RepID=U7D9U9_9BACT|nr:ribosomal protein L28 [Chitinivibrio alkaliphilus ACht1]